MKTEEFIKRFKVGDQVLMMDWEKDAGFGPFTIKKIEYDDVGLGKITGIDNWGDKVSFDVESHDWCIFKKAESSIVEEALEIVRERGKTYGDPVKTFEDVAGCFRMITGQDFDAEDVALVQILLKLVRREQSPDNRDHLRDCVGYAEIMQRINDAAKIFPKTI